MPLISFKAQQARDSILEWITSGRFAPGEQMPAERVLAQELGMNHQTVRHGLAHLVREGFVVKQPRVGNFVNRAGGQRTDIGLGLVLPEYLFHVRSHAAPSLIFQGMNQALDPRRYSVHMLAYSRGNLWEQAGQLAQSRGLRGVLLKAYDDTPVEAIEHFVRAGIQVVLYKPAPELAAGGLDWVDEDVVPPTLQMLQRLFALGHRRLAIIHYQSSNTWSRHLEVIRRFFQDHDLGPVEDALVPISNKSEREEHRINQLNIDLGDLTTRLAGDKPPTAVIVSDEVLANGVFGYCHERGLDVPGDLSIASFEDHAPLLSSVPLTAPDSLTLNEQILAVGARKLAHQIDRGASEDQPLQRGTLLAGRMQWKASIGPVPQSAIEKPQPNRPAPVASAEPALA